MRFMRVNLNEPLPRMPEFDVVFLRNVMIYYRRSGSRRWSRAHGRKGILFVGHSGLNSVTDSLRLVPSVAPK
jgi:chemotaxis protein methyltransferase CheR